MSKKDGQVGFVKVNNLWLKTEVDRTGSVEARGNWNDTAAEGGKMEGESSCPGEREMKGPAEEIVNDRMWLTMRVGLLIRKLIMCQER